MDSLSSDDVARWAAILRVWPKLNERQQAICMLRGRGIHAARLARMLNVSRPTIMRDTAKIAKLIEAQMFKT